MWGSEQTSTDWGNEIPQNDRKRSPTAKSSPSTKRFKKEDGGAPEDRPQPYKPEEIDLDEEFKLLADGAGENFQRYHDQKVTCFPVDVVSAVEKFEDILASKLLLENIKSQKYSELTPIQKWAMPAIMAGHDLIACAQTGSGKTAAFLLPILQNLLNSDLEPYDPNNDCHNPYCLIISPTRELANQIFVQANILSRDSMIKCQVIYGQVATYHLKAKLSLGCHILVATLGRLKDFVQRGWIGFSNIKYIVLDEGDRLVGDGFSGDIKELFSHATMPSRDSRQTLFFSATFREETQVNARDYLRDSFVFLTVGRIGAANSDIKQEFVRVSRQDKKRELKKILNEVPEDDKTIVFTRTKTAADMLAGFFTALNLSSTSIHGDRHQSQREQAIKAFRRGEKRFLISSPVGNRGLDLPKVALVINYDLPENIDEYVHRIGRTGRAGHAGRALSFFDDERDLEILSSLLEILKEAKQDIPDWMLELAEGKSSSANAVEDEWGLTSSKEETVVTVSNDDWGTTASNEDWGATSSKNEPTATISNDDWGTSSENWGMNSSKKERNATSSNNDWCSAPLRKDRDVTTNGDWDACSLKKERSTAAPDDDWGTSSSKEDRSATKSNDDWGASWNDGAVQRKLSSTSKRPATNYDDDSGTSGSGW